MALFGLRIVLLLALLTAVQAYIRSCDQDSCAVSLKDPIIRSAMSEIEAVLFRKRDTKRRSAVGVAFMKIAYFGKYSYYKIILEVTSGAKNEMCYVTTVPKELKGFSEDLFRWANSAQCRDWPPK